MESRAVEDDPIHTISNTSEDNFRPAEDCSDELDPTRTKSSMNSEESICETPTTSNEDSIRKTELDNNKNFNCEKSKTAGEYPKRIPSQSNDILSRQRKRLTDRGEPKTVEFTTDE